MYVTVVVYSKFLFLIMSIASNVIDVIIYIVLGT